MSARARRSDPALHYPVLRRPVDRSGFAAFFAAGFFPFEVKEFQVQA
jgi:hypothetical protein